MRCVCAHCELLLLMSARQRVRHVITHRVGVICLVSELYTQCRYYGIERRMCTKFVQCLNVHNMRQFKINSDYVTDWCFPLLLPCSTVRIYTHAMDN